MLNIVESNYYSFEAYRENVEKYVYSDCREINFQNRVVLGVLERLFINDNSLFIVDISSQYKNRESDIHSRNFYAWKYTPDLLLVKNWNYKNLKKPEEDYLAVVEIKSPTLDPISKNSKHTLEEVKNYLENGRKVILTDCYEWIFYDKNKEPKHFILHDEKEWCLKKEQNPEFIVANYDVGENRVVSEKWDELLQYIIDFCNNNFN